MVTDVRPKVSEIWDKIQNPLPLSKHEWLLLNPENVYVSKLNFNSNVVTFEAAVSAAPRIVHGSEPQNPKTPLAGLQERALDGKIYIRADGYLPFADANKVLRERVIGTYQLADTKAPPHKYELKIVDAALSGRGETVALKLVAKGGVWPFDDWGVWGDLYFIGHPRYDAPTNSVLIDDWTLSEDTEKALHKSLGHSLSPDFVRALRSRLKWRLDKRIPEMTRQLNHQLNAKIDDRTSIHATIDPVTPVGVRIDQNGLRVFVNLEGSVELDISAPSLAISTQPYQIPCPD